MRLVPGFVYFLSYIVISFIKVFLYVCIFEYLDVFFLNFCSCYQCIGLQDLVPSSPKFPHPSTQSLSQIFKRNVYKFEVNTHTWGWVLTWGKLVTVGPILITICHSLLSALSALFAASIFHVSKSYKNNLTNFNQDRQQSILCKDVFMCI